MVSRVEILDVLSCGWDVKDFLILDRRAYQKLIIKNTRLD
jgi:hypothetical protein